MATQVSRQAGRQTSPVTVRMFDPGTGWSLEQARHQLEQGYDVATVARRTGWPVAMLRSAPRLRRSPA